MNDLLYGDLTSTILGCYHRVFFNCSSHGLSEESLTKALMIELKKAGLRYREQVPVNHRYEEHKIGTGRIDLLVEGKVVLELKTLDTLHRNDQARLQAYLRDGGYAVGLLLNFGSEGPQFKRVFDPTHAPKPGEPAG